MRFFGKLFSGSKTTESIVSSFSKVIEELEAHRSAQQDRSFDLQDKIIALEDERIKVQDDLEHAGVVAAKLREIFG